VSPQPPPAPGRKRRLGEILVEAGLLSEVKLRAALSEQRKWGGKLGRTLVEMGFVDEDSMAAALSRQLNLPRVDLDKLQVPLEVVQLLRIDIAERYGVFAFEGDAKQKTLQVATSDPTNVEALQELAFNTGLRVIPSVAGPSAIDRAIRRHYYGESTTASLAASPKELGMSEVELSAHDFAAMSRSSQQAVADSLETTVPASTAEVELARQVKELGDRLTSLEKHATSQVRALRALVELLIEKGTIGQDEYVNKARTKE
jgi:type IV pilus assembly protein PilB